MDDGVYVSRHIHSKYHFTKKGFQTEHSRKDLWLTKRSRKKSPSAFKDYDFQQKKATPKMQSEDEQYKVAGDDIQNYSKVQASHLIAETSQTFTEAGVIQWTLTLILINH